MNDRDELEKLDHIPDSNKMMKYKDWPIVDVMPEGWVIDKTAGSPLSGHNFITNGKSVLNGQMRALLRVKSLPCADVVVSKLKKSEAAVPEGFKVVPVEPTTEQYGGLARDIIQWMRFTQSSNQHSESLIEWLKSMGNEIPSWLMGENEINHLSKHVLSKGTLAAIIYKSMLEAVTDGENER